MTGQVAVILPGQGSQRVGMLRQVPSTTELEVAAQVLGEDPYLWDTPEGLTHTRAVQLALLVCGVSWGRALQEAGVEANYFAGHSLGLWTAAVLAGSLDFADAVSLVNVRGQAMATATPMDGGMVQFAGVSPAAVDAAAKACRDAGRLVWVSNRNDDRTVTASGLTSGLQALTAVVTNQYGAHVRELPVAVAAHCPLMEPAQRAVAKALQEVEVRRPSVPIGGNATGRTLMTAGAVAEDLVASITTGVRWDLMTAILEQRGARLWVQVPPGSSMLGFIGPESVGIAVEETPLVRVREWVAARSVVR